MESILSNSKIKKKCQIFTPPEVVITMLDAAKYQHNLAGKKVLEYSCGSGNILAEIVRRYINCGIEEGQDKAEITKGLERDIYGVEYDQSLILTCRKRLDEIAQDLEISPINWNLLQQDTLSWNTDMHFDFIIGNPPYVTYKDLDEEIRESIKNRYSSCINGKFDYYYAFIEFGLNKLTSEGVLAQLIPNNIYKNVFAERLRSLLKQHVSEIIDYSPEKIFNDVLTSSSILVYDNANTSDNVIYKNISEKREIRIPRSSLQGKWIFRNRDLANINRFRFGDYFHASASVATLLNKAFIFESEAAKKNNIEPGILFEAASPRSMRYKKEKAIIFPYYYNDGNLCRYAAADFIQRFPNAASHLSSFADDLKNRKSDKSVKWYEYGRTQALAHLYQEKLLLSTIVSEDYEIYKLDKLVIPYSGIYITAKTEGLTLDNAKELLTSAAFRDHIKAIGTNVNGTSMRITCQDINNFFFEWE